jgi:hypothetical protein
VRPAWLGIAGLTALALSLLLASPPPANEDAGALEAVGRSLGGLRVLVTDVLFLRAERLREEGRVEEVPSLYETVLDLDPDHADAADFLAAVVGFDLVADAPDAASRRQRWERAWDLLTRARARHPHDPALEVRAADLLLEVPSHHADLASFVEERVGDRKLEGLRLLLDAARETPTLARRGRYHLLVLSEVIPALALDRLARDEAEPLLAMGDELLALRGDVLAEMSWLGTTEDGEPLAVPLDHVLRLGLGAVREIAARGRDAVPEVRARVERETPGSALARALGGA